MALCRVKWAECSLTAVPNTVACVLRGNPRIGKVACEGNVTWLAGQGTRGQGRGTDVRLSRSISVRGAYGAAGGGPVGGAGVATLELAGGLLWEGHKFCVGFDSTRGFVPVKYPAAS